jgi:hypothetical protein
VKLQEILAFLAPARVQSPVRNRKMDFVQVEWALVI